MDYMGVPDKDATSRDRLIADIYNELQEFSIDLQIRLTKIDYMDSTGKQFGVRVHDDTHNIRYLLYSYYDWQQLKEYLIDVGVFTLK